MRSAKQNVQPNSVDLPQLKSTQLERLPGVVSSNPAALRPHENPDEFVFHMLGGTIDSSWYPPKDTVVVGATSLIGKIASPLDRHRLNEQPVALLDSRDVTPSIRDALADLIYAAQNNGTNPRIVTHGTYTVIETAQHVLERQQKTVELFGENFPPVVFTASFYPPDNEIPEASVNVGFACGVGGFLKSGVYIAANGAVWDPRHTTKSIETGQFRSTHSQFVGTRLENLLIVHTGGTIGADLDPRTDTYRFDRPYFTGSKLAPWIKMPYVITDKTISAVDSRQMNSGIRLALAESLARHSDEHKRVLLLHGTFTANDTALFLEKEFRKRNINDVTVVIAVSSLPPTHRESDAPFNFGFALGALTGLEPGVYVTMNGRVYTPKHTAFDKDLARFVDLRQARSNGRRAT